jgi:hypothetical protein
MQRLCAKSAALGHADGAPKMQRMGTHEQDSNLGPLAVKLWKSFRCAPPFPQSNRLYYYEKNGMPGIPRCWFTAALLRAHLMHFLLDKHRYECMNTEMSVNAIRQTENILNFIKTIRL